jgi:hypothetical protein
MTVFVCGDSFMAPDATAPGLHFSELLGATSLARPGVGNTDICYQIKSAIAQAATYVIIGTTDSGRIEIPVQEHHGTISLENLRPGAAQTYISDTIPTFIGEEADLRNKYQLSAELRSAVRQYFLHIYDANLKQEVDQWAIQHWLQQLGDLDIPYLVLPKDFCIYQNARQAASTWTFHTDALTQQQAAEILKEHYENINVR